MDEKSVKVFMLNGSHVCNPARGYKRGNSWTKFALNTLSKEITKIMPNAEITMVNLKDYNVVYCEGCGVCVSPGGACPLEKVPGDQVEELVSMMEESDIIIFGTPVYCMNISGRMKVFIDRLSRRFFQPNLIGKVGCAVITHGTIGFEEPIKYMGHVIRTLGMKYAGFLQVNHFYTNDEDIANIARKIHDIFTGKEKYIPSEEDKKIFNDLKSEIAMKGKKIWNTFEYWREKGLLDSDYYY